MNPAHAYIKNSIVGLLLFLRLVRFFGAVRIISRVLRFVSVFSAFLEKRQKGQKGQKRQKRH
jgi:hypothetical protein